MSTGVDTRTTADIYAEAVEANDEVTDGLKNALRIVDDTREVQATTLEELNKQGEQLRDVQGNLDDVQEDAKYAQTVLDQIGCLCWCCGSNKSNKVHRPKHNQKGYKYETKTLPTSPPALNGSIAMTRMEQKPEKNEVVVSIQSEDPAVAMIEQGRKEQDNIIDQISQGLDVLKQGAQAMGTELESQDQTLEETQAKAEDAVMGVKETHNHNAFRRHLRN